jgi:hypothetical protein
MSVIGQMIKDHIRNERFSLKFCSTVLISLKEMSVIERTIEYHITNEKVQQGFISIGLLPLDQKLAMITRSKITLGMYYYNN